MPMARARFELLGRPVELRFPEAGALARFRRESSLRELAAPSKRAFALTVERPEPASPGQAERCWLELRARSFALEAPGGRARVSLDDRSGALRPFGREAQVVDFVETVLRHLATLWVRSRGGTLLHAAVVVAGGRALVCAGPSGAGKTTLGRLVAPLALFSDEFAFLLPGATGAAPRVLCPPAFGHAQRLSGEPPVARVCAACVLRQAGEDRFAPLPRSVALARLVQVPPGCARPGRELDRVARVFQGVPLEELQFGLEGSVRELVARRLQP